MIPRYTREKMGALWTEEAKLEQWLRVEIAACEALAELGIAPKSAVETIRKKAKVDPNRVAEIEAITKHDVAAFVQAVGEVVGPDARWFHFGMTSSDVLDTAFALSLVDAADIMIEGLEKLAATLASRAVEFRDTPMIGRSHGVHAEPITFGVTLAGALAEIERGIERVHRARAVIAVGKLSGVVGVYGNVTPETENIAMKKLGLAPELVSTQVVPRDRHAEYFSELAIIGAGIERISIEIRHLQRTEVREVEEGFSKGQKGSSAMPHKRNPIGTENLAGCARLLRANAHAALENVALWHQRDISHSSVERVIAPDSTILLDYMIDRLDRIIANLAVYPEAMMRNINLTRGLIFSEATLLELVRKGLSRDEAYRIVQRNAMKTWDTPGAEFRAELESDPEAMKHLSAKDIDACFNLEHHLKHAGKIVDRAVRSHQNRIMKARGLKPLVQGARGLKPLVYKNRKGQK